MDNVRVPSLHVLRFRDLIGIIETFLQRSPYFEGRRQSMRAIRSFDNRI
jgi:hypothetical protein